MTGERLFGPRGGSPDDAAASNPDPAAGTSDHGIDDASHAPGGDSPSNDSPGGDSPGGDERLVVSISPQGAPRAPESGDASTPRSMAPPPPGRPIPVAPVTGLPVEIRRWDEDTLADTEVLEAVHRRPAHLPDRDPVAVTGEDDEERHTGSWYEIPVMLLVAFTLAFLLRTFVVQVFYIPSGSMIPTLEINDRIATEKVIYRFRDIARGDVIVFAGEEPFGADLDSTTGERILIGVGQFLGVVPVDAQDFVKRVIGLPGDTVEITDGVVSVNGVALDEPYAISDSSNGAWEVPEGSLFVMGDNRPNSGDSRTSLGFIEVDEVVGRAVAKIWPLDRVGSVEGVDWDPIPEPG